MCSFTLSDVARKCNCTCIAIFVLTAEPAPAADLTVNLKMSQYIEPLSLPIDEDFLATETLQATIDVSGETFFVVPTEDDNEDEPLTGIDISIEPGEGYELNQACTPDGQCEYLLNVYADEQFWIDPGSAGLTVRDNDGPQAKNGDIAF